MLFLNQKLNFNPVMGTKIWSKDGEGSPEESKGESKNTIACQSS
jgi:predicted NACHT family NTPase